MNDKELEIRVNFKETLYHNIESLLTNIVLSIMVRKLKGTDYYDIVKGTLLPKEEDISQVKVPEIMKEEYSNADLENLAKSELLKEVKVFIKVLEANFDKKYLQALYKNISTLKVEEADDDAKNKMHSRNIDGYYSHSENKIRIASNLAIFHELFHMASCNSPQADGFLYNTIGRFINEGYTQLLTERYFTFPEEDTPLGMTYKTEVTIAHFLEKIIGQEKMEKLYLQGNLKGLIDELQNYASLDDIQEFISNGDYIVKLDVNDFKQLEDLQTKKAKYKNRINRDKAEEKIDDFLINCIEKKVANSNIPNKDKILKQLEIAHKYQNDNKHQLNKEIVANIIYKITDIRKPYEYKYTDDFIDIIGEDSFYDKYFNSGFTGIIDEMCKYAPRNEIEKIMDNYDYISNAYNEYYNHDKVKEKDKEIRLFILTCIIKKAIHESNSSELENNLKNIFYQTVPYFSDDEKEEEKLCNDIKEKFNNDEVVNKAIDECRITDFTLLAPPLHERLSNDEKNAEPAKK